MTNKHLQAKAEGSKSYFLMKDILTSGVPAVIRTALEKRNNYTVSIPGR